MINPLRFDIRNFAIRYFDGQSSHPTLHKDTDYSEHLRSCTPDAGALESYLVSHTKCPILIQGFLWRVICFEIFDKFQWAGSAQQSAHNLTRLLDPGA